MIPLILTNPKTQWPVANLTVNHDQVGHCLLCNKLTYFYLENDSPFPNIKFKESMRCSDCNLIARQRAVMAELKNMVRPGHVVWFQEKFMSASLAWAERNLLHCDLLGTDYMPDKSATDIQHQDVTQLTFCNNTFNIIVSQDVFEHVHNPWLGFQECLRVLKPGGTMLMTIPFAPDPLDVSIDRRTNNLPDIYHGDPQGPLGSFLCYTDFGWDLIDRLKDIGWIVELKIYHSAELGWPAPILIFNLQKPLSVHPL